MALLNNDFHAFRLTTQPHGNTSPLNRVIYLLLMPVIKFCMCMSFICFLYGEHFCRLLCTHVRLYKNLSTESYILPSIRRGVEVTAQPLALVQNHSQCNINILQCQQSMHYINIALQLMHYKYIMHPLWLAQCTTCNMQHIWCL